MVCPSVRIFILAAALGRLGRALRPEKSKPVCGLAVFGALDASATLGDAKTALQAECEVTYPGVLCAAAVAELWEGQDLTADIASASSEMCASLGRAVDLAQRSALAGQSADSSGTDSAISRKIGSAPQESDTGFSTPTPPRSLPLGKLYTNISGTSFNGDVFALEPHPGHVRCPGPSGSNSLDPVRNYEECESIALAVWDAEGWPQPEEDPNVPLNDQSIRAPNGCSFKITHDWFVGRFVSLWRNPDQVEVTSDPGWRLLCKVTPMISSAE